MKRRTPPDTEPEPKRHKHNSDDENIKVYICVYHDNDISICSIYGCSGVENIVETEKYNYVC